FGQVALSKEHSYCKKVNNSFVSPYLQNLMGIAGASDVYSKANGLFSHFLRIQVSISGVYR
ncbi:MAG: hypothetical protein J0L94_10320, partial [Rhodothermia bacterium]|nr:hypothetical protein [Rhodothermia bacterium]